MTKEKLEQLSDLKKEITEIEESINKLSNMQCSGKVKASMHCFPYIEGHMTVGGIEPGAHQRIDEKQRILWERKIKAQKLETEIYEYINSVDDSRVRRIMQKRYIDNKDWETIADEMGYERTYCRLSSKIEHFFRKLTDRIEHSNLSVISIFYV